MVIDNALRPTWPGGRLARGAARNGRFSALLKLPFPIQCSRRAAVLSFGLLLLGPASASVTREHH